MFWNLKLVCPELLLIEILKFKIRTKSQIEKLLPEQKLNKEPMLIVRLSSQNIAKPNVVRIPN
jgi:hypothetical protein